MRFLESFKKQKSLLPVTLIFVIAALFIPEITHAGIFDWLSPMTWLNFVVAQIGTLVLWIVGILVVLAGWLLDLSIWVSVANFSQYAEMPIIRIGWTIIRDLCNIFFIFVILYIAISTILQLSHDGIGKLLSRVIIAALLINFSFPITLFVIDASNVVSYGFYKKMGGGEFNPFDSELSIAGRIIGGLQLPGAIKAIDDPAEVGAAYAKMNLFPIILNTLGGVAVELVVVIVLLIAALLFTVRTIAFLFLLILSPFGFLAMAVPGLSSIGEEWRGALFKYALSAPAFLFMFYIATSLIAGGDGSLRAIIYGGSPMGLNAGIQQFLAQVSLGVVQKENLNILLYFTIAIGFFIGTLMVGAKMGAAGAAAAEHFVVGAGKSAGAWLGDHTYGRAARAVRRSDRFSDFAAKEYKGKFTKYLNPLKNWTVKNVMYKPLVGASGGYDSRALRGIEEDKAMAEDIGRDEHGSNRRDRLDLRHLPRKEAERIRKTELKAAEKALEDFEQDEKARTDALQDALDDEYTRPGGTMTDAEYDARKRAITKMMVDERVKLELNVREAKGIRRRDLLIGNMSNTSLGVFEDLSTSHLKFIREKTDGAAVLKEAKDLIQKGQDGIVSRGITEDVLKGIKEHLGPDVIVDEHIDPTGRKDAKGNPLKIIEIRGSQYVRDDQKRTILRQIDMAQSEIKEDIDDAHAVMRGGHGASDGGH